jgi:FkbM family methyltransferase
MPSNGIKAATIRSFCILTLVSAWSLIPLALLISFLPPFSLPARIALTVLPIVIFVSWMIKLSLCGKLSRKVSPIAFYLALATNLLFLCMAAAYIRVGDLTSIKKGVFHLFHMKDSPAVGIMADHSQRYRLFKDGVKLDFLRATQSQGSVRILNYEIPPYGYGAVRYMFNDIFIDQQYFFKSDSPRPFIIDCGSNIGMSILYFKTLYPESAIIGFEPAPDNFRILTENIRQNRLKDVVLVNKAVGGEEGKMKFYGDDSLTASLVASRAAGQRVTEVDVVRLSGYIDRPVDFLKLDIEGAEPVVLEDLAKTSKLQMIRQMTIEYHHHITPEEDSLSGFLKVLEDNKFGYQIQAAPDPPHSKKIFQDVMIYAYRK